MNLHAGFGNVKPANHGLVADATESIIHLKRIFDPPALLDFPALFKGMIPRVSAECTQIRLNLFFHRINFKQPWAKCQDDCTVAPTLSHRPSHDIKQIIRRVLAAEDGISGLRHPACNY